MVIKVRQMPLSSSKYSLKSPRTMVAETITVHNTWNDASANNEVSYMINNSNATSFHTAIDDKEVVQAIPYNRNAHHAGDGSGDGNRKSISIEICYSKSGGERYKKAEALATKYIAQLLHERKWGIDRVRTHKSWSGKNCPHRILDEGRWNSFLKRVEDQLKILNGVTTVDKASTTPKPTSPNNTNNGGGKILKYSIGQFRVEWKELLKKAQDAEAVSSDSWYKKADNGTMTEDEAINLLATIFNRMLDDTIKK